MKDWHAEDIKAALRKRHSSFADIARSLNVSGTSITNVAKGSRSERVEKAIADALGLTVQEVFPSRKPVFRKAA